LTTKPGRKGEKGRKRKVGKSKKRKLDNKGRKKETRIEGGRERE